MDDLQNQEKTDGKRKTDYKKVKLAYEVLLQIRDLDNGLMWTRVNTMLTIQGILFSFVASSFASLMNKFPWVVVLIAIFGFISAYFMRWIAIGGSFWVNYWQEKLSKIEHEVLGEIEVFRNLPHSRDDPNARKELRKKGYRSTRNAIIFFLHCLWLFG